METAEPKWNRLYRETKVDNCKPVSMFNGDFPIDSSSGRGSAWLERTVRDREVAGSNPVAPIDTSRLPNTR